MKKMPHLHEWLSISFNVEEKESKHDNLIKSRSFSECKIQRFNLTRDLEGLRVYSPCDKHPLFNYYKWCTSFDSI